MRVKFSRGLCVAFLYCLTHLLLPSCSSSQQEDADADLEGSEQGEEAAQGEEGGDEATAQEGEADSQEMANEAAAQGEEGEEVAEENAELAENEGANNQVLNDEQTASDLQAATENGNAGEMNAGEVAQAEVEAPPVETPVEEAVPDQAAMAAAPAGVSAGKSLPEMGSKMPYVVRVGDTLAQIAQKIYGASDKWNEMAELTALKDPNMVKPGDVVYYRLSDVTLAFASAYEQTAKAEVKVQKGDSLSIIAKRVYGNPGDWKYVWRQNGNIDNPDSIEVGQTIYYLAPAALGAALDYAKSVKLADLLPSTDKDTGSKSQAQAQDQDNTVNGFEIAKNMFDIFASQLNIAG